jgi:hypothetical protein
MGVFSLLCSILVWCAKWLDDDERDEGESESPRSGVEARESVMRTTPKQMSTAAVVPSHYLHHHAAPFQRFALFSLFCIQNDENTPAETLLNLHTRAKQFVSEFLHGVTKSIISG